MQAEDATVAPSMARFRDGKEKRLQFTNPDDAAAARGMVILLVAACFHTTIALPRYVEMVLNEPATVNTFNTLKTRISGGGMSGSTDSTGEWTGVPVFAHAG